MEASEKQAKYLRLRWFLLRLAFVVFDILAVNFAYFIALVIRFYVAFEFNEWATGYVPAFLKFAPWYTAGCLVIFFGFRLYNSRWKYAGMHDMNRILMACIATSVLQVVGSMVFVMRMPVTYYLIGGVIQFVMIAGSRFAYRFFLLEREHVRKHRSETSIPVLIAGVGETSHVVRKHLERNVETAAHPVCILDFRAGGFGNMLEGLPVVNGVDKLSAAIEKYAVECVILSDATMPESVRTEIQEICKNRNVEVQDFSGFFQDSRGAVTLRNLMEYASGEVELVMNGEHRRFANGEQALMSAAGRYIVKSISGCENRLVIELQTDILVPNDVKEEWVRSYEEETGSDISFF